MYDKRGDAQASDWHSPKQMDNTGGPVLDNLPHEVLQTCRRGWPSASVLAQATAERPGLTVEAQHGERSLCCSMGDQKGSPDENPGTPCQLVAWLESSEPAGPNHPTKPLVDPFPSANASD